MDIEIKRGGPKTCRERNARPVIVFDGVCHLCNGLVDFIIRHDPKKKFRFAAMQTRAGEEIRRNFGDATLGADSVMLIEGEDYAVKSDAILRIAEILGGPWRATTVLRLIPRRWRDVLYDTVASRRYRWFGRQDSCHLPDDRTRERFI